MVVSVVRRRPSAVSKDFCSETTWPISTKLDMRPSSKGGKKVYVFGPGHVTKIATMPIYGKNLKKPSSQEPRDRLP